LVTMLTAARIEHGWRKTPRRQAGLLAVPLLRRILANLAQI
jgi:hypothetical protein